jgi:mxaC protein
MNPATWPVQFDHPVVLLLLPLAWWAWRRGAAQQWQSHPWLALVPADAWSTWLDRLLRWLAALAVAACVLALASPYRPEHVQQRVAQGAELVVVFDRSSSMDDRFRRVRDAWSPADSVNESKAAVARRLLKRFARERDHDAFALVHFAENPIDFLPFTQKTELVQSAMDAAAIGRGLGNTDLGRGMLAGAALFEGRPYLGSRVLLLVSDGGAQLDEDTRQRLAAALRRQRVSLYWLYLRGSHGRPLEAASPEEAVAIPEQSLHLFFQQAGVPYKAYATEQPEAVARAIADLGRLEQRPLIVQERLPRSELSGWALGWALGCCALLLLARTWQVPASTLPDNTARWRAPSRP